MKKSDLKIYENAFNFVNEDYQSPDPCLIIDAEALADEYAEHLPDADATGEDLEDFEGKEVRVGKSSNEEWFVIDGENFTPLIENPFTTQEAGLLCLGKWELFEDEETNEMD